MDSSTPPDPLTAAQSYLGRGWAPIPVPDRSKAPTIPGWQHLRLSDADLSGAFGSSRGNVGILLGDPSGGLVDVDLDCPYARRLAPRLLPPTDAVFGRPSTPSSHRLYVVTEPLRTTKYQDPTATSGESRATLVELRSTGTQTIVPPSVHPSGEGVRWDQEDSPMLVDATELRNAVATLAAGALLARRWPEGSRHDASLALAGGLMRVGWAPIRVADFVLAVAEAAGDDELTDRERAVQSTIDGHRSGRTMTGWSRLAELVGAPVVDRVRIWLGLRSYTTPESSSSRVAGTSAGGDGDDADDPELTFSGDGTSGPPR